MKKLIISKEKPEGVIIEVKDEVFEIPYEERVATRVRDIYTVDEELALNRKATAALARGEELPDDFIRYNQVVEQIKEEERHGS